MEDLVMADDYGNLFDDPIEDVREDLGNVPSNNESYGFTYFVDSNAGNDGNDGLSKEEPFKTLAKAIIASNLTISTHPDLASAGFAARNRILYKGDSNTEAFTTLPDKCDVVGSGSGGGHRTMPQIIGEHLIVDTVIGCRFYNMGFVPATNGGNIFTLPATCRGIEFHGCRFESGNGAVIAGSAIVATANWFLKIIDCEFTKRFSDAVIEILAGNAEGTVIRNNVIEGLNEGINLVTGVLDTDNVILIEDNRFITTLACINDVDGIAYVMNNTGITAAARGLKQAGAVVGSVLRSAGNFFTCSDGLNMPWPASSPVWNEDGGRTYYVDSNDGDAANSGSSWDDALDTLTAALALSQANIGLGNSTFAARNTIKYKGDGNTESLTTLARGTDIVGIGKGGGHVTRAHLIGTHLIGAGAFEGCRFYNFNFVPVSGTDDIFTAPATCRGLEFHNCIFDGSAPIAGSAIVVTALWFLKVMDCEFVGQFTDAVIEVLAGNAQGTTIKGNYIEGAENGIEFVTGLDADPRGITVEDNVIDTGAICINDVDAAFVAIINNNCITATTDGGAAGASIIVGDVQRGNGNKVSASDATNADWPKTVALA